MIVEDELECRLEEIDKFKYWLQADKFDRKRANRWLMQYSQGDHPKPGACGNVSYGGIRIPPHKPKGCESETLCL